MNQDFTRFYNDSQVADLPYEDQLWIFYNKILPKMAADPEIQSLSPEDQDYVLRRAATSPVPVLKNKALENELRAMRQDSLEGDKGKQRLYAFGDEALKSSGFIGAVTKYLYTPIMNALGMQDNPLTYENLYGDDSAKATQYVKNLIGATNDTLGKALGVTGSITGTMLDWIGAGLAEAPIVTGVAEAGVSRFAPKLLQMFPSANARTLVTAAEIMTPQAVDAIMDGILNIPREEFLAEMRKEPSPMSQGAGKVAMNFGVGAAFDFGLGTMISTALTVPKVFSRVFRKSPHLKGEIGAEEIDDAILRIRNGTLPEARWNLLDEKQQAFAIQQAKIGDFLDSTNLSQEVQPMGRLYLLAQDTGSIVDARKEGGWKLYTPGKEGLIVEETKDYLGTLNKLTDDLYSQARKLSLEKKAVFMEAHGWEMNYASMRNASKDTMESLRATALKGAPLDSSTNTFTVSSSEADALIRASSPEGMISFKVNADYEDAILRISRKEKSILPSVGKEVAPDPLGNAVVIVKKAASPEEFEAATVIAKKATLVNPEVSMDTYRRATLMSNGYDAAQLPNGHLLILSDNAFKMIMSDDVLKGAKALKKTLGNPIPNNIVVAGEMNTLLKGRELIADRKTLTDAILKVSRSVNEEDATKLARAYLADVPVDSNRIKVHVVPKDNFVTATRSVVRNGGLKDEVIDIYIPKRFTTQGAERKFIYDFIGSMDLLAREAGSDLTTPKKSVIDRIINKSDLRFEIPQGVGIQSETWLDSVVKDLGGQHSYVNGNHVLQFPGDRGPMEFKNLEDAIDFTARLTITPDVLKEDLLLKSIRMTEKSDGTLSVVGKGIDGRIEAKTVPELLARLNYLPEKLDVRYGPKEVLLIDEGVKVGGFGFAGTRKQVLQMLDKFEDKHLKSQSSLVGDFGKGAVYQGPDGSFRLEVPEIKYEKHFDSIKEAKSFLDELDTLPILQEVAEAKGFMLRIGTNGEYVVYGGGKKLVAKDQESLWKLFTDYPDPKKGAPSLFATTNPEVELTARDVLKMYKSTEFPESKPLLYNDAFEIPDGKNMVMDTWLTFKEHTSRTTKWMEDYARKVDPSFMLLFRKMELGLKNSSVELGEALKIVDASFKMPSGKRIPLKRRKELFSYMGALERGEDGQAFMKQIHASILNPSELESMESVRKYWNSLSNKFGIKTQDFIFNYSSRILDWHATANKELINEMTNAGDMIESIFGKDRVGQEIKAFFENARVSDVLSFAAKDDLMEVLTQYTTTGMKKYYLNDAWKEVDSYIKKNASKLDPDFTRRVNYYREAVMGYNKTNTERLIANLGEKAFGSVYDNRLFGAPLRMAKVSREEFTKVGRNILGVFSGLQSLAAMGFKPALALRNYTQVYSILAGRVGITNVHKAVKETLEGGTEYFKYLKRLGIISDAPPLVNEIYLGEGAYAKFQEMGLSWFKNSDDLTRAIAFRVGNNFIEDGLRIKRTVPNVSERQVAEVMGLDLIPEDLRGTVSNLLRGGQKDVDSAKLILGEYLNNSTMFSYTKADAPMMFHGLIGKAFGQFGTYSAGYRAVLSDGLRYGNKAAFISRFVGINMALWGATSALGMKFNDYVPLLPALFSGGPLFDTGVAIAQSLDPSYEGKQARQRALDGIMRMAPGTSQIAYAKKAIKYSEQGDSWKAFLALTSTPTRSE